MNDDELKKRFEQLRSEERRVAPSFAATLAHRRRGSKLGWALLPVGALVATLALALWFVPLIAVRRGDGAIAHVGLREPEPLAFLLEPVPMPEGSEP